MPTLTLHTLAPSPPCAAVEAALRSQGLDYENVALPMDGTHKEILAGIYGEGSTTVPQMLIGDERVRSSNAILERIDELAPEAPSLFPEPIAPQVRDAIAWADEHLQPLGRSLSWGALYFKPDALGTLGGAGMLDPAGTDFAIRLTRSRWRALELSCVLIAEQIAGLPAMLDHADQLVADGIAGDPEHPNAADFQIGATLAVLKLVGDLAPILEGRPCLVLTETVPPRSGLVPAGAFPASIVGG